MDGISMAVESRKMKKLRLAVVALMLVCLLFAAQPVGALPPTPASFSGTVKLNGENVPPGIVISAWINGVRYAYTTALLYERSTWYTLTVPGDELATPAVIEGGRNGDTIYFYIGPIPAGTSIWYEGGDHKNFSLAGTGTVIMLPLVIK